MRLKRSTWFLAVVTLCCLGAAPALWYLAHVGVLPATRWEARWELLRRTSAANTDAVTDDSFVSLRRTGCFGYCPIYHVTVFGSGRVEYVGEVHVCDVGPRTAMIGQESAAKLIADLAGAGYFEIDWKPGNRWTDDSTAVTRLSTNGRARTIDEYHGDEGVPRVMRLFEDAIDEVAGTGRWLPKLEAGNLFCIAADGTRRPLAGS